MKGLEHVQNLKISAINTQKVHHQVYNQLKRLLMQRAWKAGEKIPSEHQLTLMFGVSRISVKSAIKSLVAQGFLDTRQGEGTFVLDASIDQNLTLLIPMMNYTRESLLEVLQFRRMIEVGMMPVVIEHLSETHLETIEKSVQRLEQTDESMTNQIVDLDLEFHRRLCTIAQNRLVLKVNEILSELYRHSITNVVENFGSVLGRVYYRKIYNTLVDRDIEAAKNTMEEHLMRTINEIEQISAERFQCRA